MKKRGRGIRSRIYFDHIDLEILKELPKHSLNGLGVLGLAKKIRVQHRTLKFHLDKLFYLGLIGITSSSKGKIKAVLVPVGSDDYDTKEVKRLFSKEERDDMKKDAERQKMILRLFKRADEYFTKKTKSDYDLRRTKNLRKRQSLSNFARGLENNW